MIPYPKGSTMQDVLSTSEIRIPGARRLFRAAQHHIDHIMSTTTAELYPERAYEWCWDVILQLGRDLDRLAAKQDRRTFLSVPTGKVAA
jgi:hypothetical protein